MKTPKEDRKTVRTSTFTVPASEEEKDAIKRMADKHGLTMSAWVRMVILEKMNQN